MIFQRGMAAFILASANLALQAKVPAGTEGYKKPKHWQKKRRRKLKGYQK